MADQTPKAKSDGKPILGKICLATSILLGLTGTFLGGMSYLKTTNLLKQQTYINGELYSKIEKTTELTKNKSDNHQYDEKNITQMIDNIFAENPMIIASIVRDEISNIDLSENNPPIQQQVDYSEINNIVKTNINSEISSIHELTDRNYKLIQSNRKSLYNQQDKIANIEKKQNLLIASDTPKKSITSKKRLKEFNIIAPIKDGSFFIVEAPSKNGKPNIITLTIDEPFRSKLGSHKVTGLVRNKSGKPVLEISGGFFIDSKREEFTKAELNLLSQNRNKTQARVKNKQKSSSSKTTKPEKTIAQNKPRTKLILGDWQVITPEPETQSVIVANKSNNEIYRVKENSYIANIGTVKSINFKTGETCFEKYCIKGL